MAHGVYNVGYNQTLLWPRSALGAAEFAKGRKRAKSCRKLWQIHFKDGKRHNLWKFKARMGPQENYVGSLNNPPLPHIMIQLDITIPTNLTVSRAAVGLGVYTSPLSVI